MSLNDMSVEELELRISLANIALKWLNSDDPMLKEEEYRDLVDPTIHRVTNELRQLIVACREKKVQREQAQVEFLENVEIGLKPARMIARKKKL